MSGTTLASLTREELEAEITKLRGNGCRNSQNALRKLAIFDSALDFAMVVTDPGGIITDWNVGAERIMGWTASEMRGQDASRFFTPEDRANNRLLVEMEAALREGRAADVRWHLRKDGRRFWASGEMTPLQGEDGAHLGFVKIVRDRTSEHLAIIELRQREKNRRALLEMSDQMASTQNVATLTDIACAMLGETLDVKLTGYGLVDAQAETITVEKDWTAGPLASIAGILHFRQYGSYIEELKRGETVIVNDVFQDPRTRQNVEAMEKINVRALVNMPVTEQGRLVAVLFVCDDQPHQWTREELDFIREVASRTHSRTARRRAERELQTSERRLAALTEASTEVRFRISPDWSELYELWGGNFIATTVQADIGWMLGYIPERSRSAVLTEIDRATRSRTQYALEHEVYLLDGSIGWAATRAVPTLDDSGAIIEWFGVAANITDRRRAEAALQMLNATLEQQIEARTAERNRIWQVSRDMLLVADLAGVWLAVNPAWTASLGWEEDELLGRTSGWLEHPDDHQATRQVIQHLAGGNPTLSFENRLRTRSGAYRSLAWTAVTSDDKIYAVARDVTDERAQAAALASAEEALRQSQKMEAVGQLTGGLAHDFNNLLAGISGGLELLSIRIGQGRLKDLERYLSAAQGATQRAAALTHRLLAFSRRQTLAPTPTDTNELVDGLLDLIRRTVGPATEVKAELDAEQWIIRVDPPQLENALLNLCINARDAMPEGGVITIATVNRTLEQKEAAQYDIPVGDYLMLSVSDTGTGMSPEVMAKVFDPFFTTKPIGQGTGLGLSMLYGFARQSGGHARISSELGRGSSVIIYLPRYHGVLEHQEKQIDAQALPPAIQGETVLVIDDEPTVRLLITEVLEDLGYIAIEASEGAGGLAVLQSDARVDLLITDVGLPGGLNGRQVADAGRVSRPDLKVLFITGYAEASLFVHGDTTEGMRVMTKPFSFDALASRIREMLE